MSAGFHKKMLLGLLNGCPMGAPVPTCALAAYRVMDYATAINALDAANGRDAEKLYLAHKACLSDRIMAD